MVEGSVQKYLKEVTLLGQPFVKDDKQTVEQLLKARGASVNRFVLYVVGEGIEKKTSDFAAEVAAQAAAASRGGLEGRMPRAMPATRCRASRPAPKGP